MRDNNLLNVNNTVTPDEQNKFLEKEKSMEIKKAVRGKK